MDSVSIKPLARPRYTIKTWVLACGGPARTPEWRLMSNLTEAPRPSLLSDQSLSVVQATAPVVAAHADEITARFYPRMFAAHPELLHVFNQGNQATGEQSKALAGSVVAYAVQLIDPEAPSFDHVMRRIAYKHFSLGIRPEQYTIVGEHLLASVGEVLGDAVTPEIAAAWSEVYWLFALQLVAEEARLYQEANVDLSQPTRPYRVVRRIEETADVISLVLEPADGGALPAIAPGQYVSVFVDLPDGDRQPRQYTVSSTAVRTRLQITVRRVRGVNGAPDGRVSSYLHDQIEIGDQLDVSAPAGDFVLTPTDSPLLLASAGAGITTVLPIVEHIARTQPQRPVIVAQLLGQVGVAGQRHRPPGLEAELEEGPRRVDLPDRLAQARGGHLDRHVGLRYPVHRQLVAAPPVPPPRGRSL